MKKSFTWEPIANLMFALMVMFLLIAIFFMSRTSQNIVEKESTIITFRDNKDQLYSVLTNSFSDLITDKTIEIDQNLRIRFIAPINYFLVSQSELTPAYAQILDGFTPKYISILSEWNQKHPDQLAEIRVEGHTSSIWTKDTPPTEGYFFNMELSQNRARNVVHYIMNKYIDTKEWDFLTHYVTANGLSSSRLITDENGIENTAKSMRVEFAILLDSQKIVEKLTETVVDKTVSE